MQENEDRSVLYSFSVVLLHITLNSAASEVNAFKGTNPSLLHSQVEPPRLCLQSAMITAPLAGSARIPGRALPADLPLDLLHPQLEALWRCCWHCWYTGPSVTSAPVTQQRLAGDAAGYS